MNEKLLEQIISLYETELLSITSVAVAFVFRKVQECFHLQTFRCIAHFSLNSSFCALNTLTRFILPRKMCN